MNINLLIVFSFITVVTNFGIAFALALRCKDNTSARIFSGVAVGSGLWALAQGMFTVLGKTSYQDSLFWWQVGYTGVIFVVVFFTHFVVDYVDRFAEKKKFIFIVYFLGALFVFFNWYDDSKLFLGKLSIFYDSFYWHDWILNKSLLYLLFYISFYWLILGYAFILLIKTYFSSFGIRRNQLKYFILGAIVGWLGSELEILVDFRIYIYPYSVLFIGLYPFIIAYAILRYHLMDIRVAITNAGIFLAVYALVLGLPFYVGYETHDWVWSTTFAVILATLGPLLYRGLQRKAEDKLMAQQRRYQKLTPRGG